MQHLDRRFEHLDEFQQTLVGTIEATGIAVGVGIILGKGLELTNIDLTNQRRDILVVLVARLGLGNGDLPQARRLDLYDAKLRDVAAEPFKPLETPWTHQPG